MSGAPTGARALGWIAAVFTTLAFIPQSVLIYETQNVSGMSLLTYTIYAWGLFMWFVYGYMMNDWPTMFSGVAGLLPVLYIVSVIHRKNELARKKLGIENEKKGRVAP